MGETYEAAGVSLGAADEVVARIGPLARSTFRPEVLAGVGGFGGLVTLPAGCREPVLVSSTDGVGTKLKVAELAGRFDTIGLDLVAMCVDDVAVQGADPLFFLDYIGAGRLDPIVVEEIVGGVAAGCRLAGCALVGGETAEHGDGHALDLAGFAVGVVERSELLTGDDVRPGDVLVGLPSGGLRSNGYSLARRVLLPAWDGGAGPGAAVGAGTGTGVGSACRPELLDEPAWEGADTSLADELLRPSIICSPVMAALRRAVPVHAFAHITGGGIPGNLPRVLPADVDAVVRLGSWPVPRIFREIQRRGEVAADEMARVFNLGLAMIAVVPGDAVEGSLAVLHDHGVDALVVGEVVPGHGHAHLT